MQDIVQMPFQIFILDHTFQGKNIDVPKTPWIVETVLERVSSNSGLKILNFRHHATGVWDHAFTWQEGMARYCKVTRQITEYAFY